METPSGDLVTNTWDGENRLVATEQPDGTLVTNLYDADSHRVERDDGVDVARYVYDGHNVLVQTDDMGVTEAAYTLQPQPYGNLVSLNRDAESHFFHFDGIHNTSDLTDDTETVTDEYRHTAWGKPFSSTGTTDNSHTYKGQIGYERDPNLDTDEECYRRHHRISSAAGHFTSDDPAEDDLNFSRDVGNNPVNKSDPSGLQETRRGNIIYRDGSVRHNVEIDASLLETLIANGRVLMFEPTDGRSAPISRRPAPLEPFLGNPQAKAEDERQRREAEAAKRGPARRVLITPFSELREKGVSELGVETLEEGGYEFVGRTERALHAAIGLSGRVSGTLQSLKDSEGRILLRYWEYVDESDQRLYLVPVRMKSESDSVFAGYSVYESPEEVRNAYALMQSLVLTGALIAETAGIYAGEIGATGPVPLRPRPSLRPGRIIGEAAEEAAEKVAGDVIGEAIKLTPEDKLLRVVEVGKPQFQLKQGEPGLSVFLERQVGGGEILPSFRQGSQITGKSVQEIESLGLKVVKTKGDPSLPVKLQNSHYEIRPGEGMTRKQFKRAIKQLEPDG